MSALYSAERISSSRHNVLYVAVAQLMFSITLVAMGVILLYSLGEEILDVDAVALDLHIFAYFFLALCTALGICGSLYRSRGLVAMFCSMTLAQLVFGIGSGIYCLSVLFDDPGDIVTAHLRHKCLSLDQFSQGFCNRTPFMKYLTLALFIQIWLIQILGLYSSQAYVQELMDVEGDYVKDIDEYEYDYW